MKGYELAMKGYERASIQQRIKDGAQRPYSVMQ
jgi:hypothetical protein